MRKNKITCPTRFWDTEIGGIIASLFMGMLFTSIFCAGISRAYANAKGLEEIAIFGVVSLLGLLISGCLIILPKGATYMVKKKVIKNFDFSIFKKDYVLISSISLKIPMFWGEVELTADCSRAKEIPTVLDLQRALALSGTPNDPQEGCEEEAALFLARRNIILKDVKITRDMDYDPEKYYEGALSLCSLSA